MNKNLTLTLDADLLKAARRFALEHDTSVNQIVRDFLKAVAEKKDTAKATRAQLQKFFRTSRFELGPVTWTRDGLHDRSR